jgi:hypothetical protein
LRASPALASRLATAEAELGQLEAAVRQEDAPKANVEKLLADLPARARQAVDRLEETLAAGDITRTRHEIRNQVGVVTVESDDREIRLYSEQGHVATALLRAAGCLVARGGFDLCIRHPLRLPIVPASLTYCLD